MSVKMQSEAVNLIAAYIQAQRGRMLQLLQQLVDIESPTDHPEGVNRVGAILKRELLEAGFQVQVLKESAYGDHILADYEVQGTPRVLLMGHMDTVFPLGTGWKFTMDGERAYGPGVIDMKSGDLAALFAFKALQATVGVPLSVRIFYNSDEEPGSPASRQLIPGVADGVDWAFVLEPAEPDGHVVSTRKGVGIFRFQVTGRAAHAGQEPEKGINANIELMHQLLEAARLARPEAGTTVNPGTIAGGTQPYVIPEFAEGAVDVRVQTLKEQQRIEKAFQALPASQVVPGARLVVTGGFHRPPMPETPGTLFLKDVYGQACACAGQAVVFGGSGAVSDGNNIAAAGVPVLDGVGPVGGRLHSRDEYLELESFFQRTVALATSLYLLGGKADAAGSGTFS
ncbi:M20 family metallopeptidase [Paenibacillus sp. S150]|uniref:M20 family metallopeptidase n=1 Tax=Paenibacillus sp. S150 TaxID=2749826 RepID=UPI001C56A02D|nr:M20 family metallopeptidase [Paenibacillus sp. S150]MBW4082002.1 M20 family metallopeptidase [Paenibacillus sp. S150]